jgi:hypothetical protein
VQLGVSANEDGHNTRRALKMKAHGKGRYRKLLWDLAPIIGDKCLRQSGTVTLKPWQQEIRDYVITAKKPTFFALDSLVRWAKLKRLV